MKFIKTNWIYILLFILFMVLSYFFPFTNNDLLFLKTESINTLLSYSYGLLLPSALIVLLMKIKLIKIMTYGILSVCLFILMKKIVHKNNKSLPFIAVFVFFLMNTNILTESYISISSFCTNFLSSIFLLIIVNYLIKDTLYKLNKYVIFILGFISATISPIASSVLFIIIGSISVYNDIKKRPDKSIDILFSGITVGIILELLIMNLLGCSYKLPNLTDNLLYNIVPMLYNVNFLIILIQIAFLLFLSIKVYMRGKKTTRINVILSIIVITAYSFATLMSKNIYLNYVMLILFNIVSIYVLLNANNSIRFKNKIKIYYLFKIIYIISLIFIANVNESYLLMPILIDILIILELFNYVFPNDFLKTPWIIISLLILISNIYIYKNIYTKNIQLKNYIRHHLECNIFTIDLPSKYNNEYMKEYIPLSLEEKNNYLKYIDLDLNKEYNIHINN